MAMILLIGMALMGAGLYGLFGVGLATVIWCFLVLLNMED